MSPRKRIAVSSGSESENDSSSSSDWDSELEGSNKERNDKSKGINSRQSRILNEVKRNIDNWIAFRKDNLVLPLVAHNIRRSRKPIPVQLNFKSLTKFRPPTVLRPRRNSNKLGYCFHVSLYHSGSKRFFGNTWVSPDTKLRDRKLDLDCSVFFKTSIVDPICVVVIEVVAVEKDAITKEKVLEYGCGWTMLPVFSAISDMPEFEKSNGRKGGTRLRITKAKFYSGSPRALMFVNDSKSEKQLQLIPDSTFSYNVCGVNPSGFGKATHLLRENELIGVTDPLFGIKPQKNNKPTLPKNISSKLRFLSSKSLYISDISIFIPNGWEEKASKHFSNREDIDSNETGKYVLKVAPHNGRTVISNHGWTNINLRAKESDKHEWYDQRLQFGKQVKVEGFVLSPNVGLVCQLEYIQENMIVVFGCAVWIPFPNKDTACLSNVKAKTSLSQRSLELELRTDIQRPFTSGSLYLPFESESEMEHSPILGFTISQRKDKTSKKKNFDADTTTDDDSASESEARDSDSRGGSDDSSRQSEDDSFDSFSDLSDKSSKNGYSSGEENRNSHNSRKRRKNKERRSPSNRSRKTTSRSKKHDDILDFDLLASLNINQANQPGSLLATTLNMPLHDKNGNAKAGYDDVVVTNDYSPTHAKYKGKTSNSLSRASRTLLRDHGFNDIADESRVKSMNIPKVDDIADIGLELRDHLKGNEITFQFAAYRYARGDINVPKPKSIFLTFQFYDFLPTRTERMTLKSSDFASGLEDLGEQSMSHPYILTCGKSSRNRNSPSLALKYFTDTTIRGQSNEADFANYLSKKTLYVHVWDGDSLLPLGTTAIELSGLMRQGEKMVKLAEEYDIVMPNMGQDIIDIYPGALMRGRLIGKLQMIITNCGIKVKNHCENNNSSLVQQNQPKLNWRVEQTFNNMKHASNTHNNPPLHRVSAKPLAKCDKQLKTLLNATLEGSKYRLSPKRRRDKHSGLLLENDTTPKQNEEWVFTEAELAALTSALDQQDRGQIGIDRLFNYVGFSKNTNKNMKISKLEKYFTVADYQLFIEADTRLDGTVDKSSFQRFLCDCIVKRGGTISDFECKSVCDMFVVKQSGRVKYEKFLDKILNDDTAIMESKLRRILRKARDSNGLTLKDAFDQHFDENGDGVIGSRELKSSLQKLGFNATEKQLETILTRYGDGKQLRYTDFVGLADRSETASKSLASKLRKVLLEGKKKGLKVKQIFKHFDENDDGKISKTEFEHGLEKIGISPKSGELDEFLVEIDKDSSGTIDMKEFFAYLDPNAPAKSSVVDKLREILQEGKKKGLKTKQIFKHFDKDGNGEITLKEFKAGLKSMGFSASKNEIEVVMGKIDEDGDGTINIEELVLFLDNKPNNAKNANPSRPSLRVIKKLKRTLQEGKKKGLKVRQIFDHFDKSDNGEITMNELKDGLEKMDFSVSSEELGDLMQHMDRDSDGKIDIKELVVFLDEQQPDDSYSDNEKGNINKSGESIRSDSVDEPTLPEVDSEDVKEGVEHDAQQVLRKLRKVILKAKKQGIKIEESFSHFDKNGDGKVDKSQLKKALLELGFEVESNPGEVDVLMNYFDVDGDGFFSRDEFLSFVLQSGDFTEHHLTQAIENHGKKLLKLCTRQDKKDTGLLSLRRFEKLLDNVGVTEKSDLERTLRDLGVLDSEDRVMYMKLFAVHKIKAKLRRCIHHITKRGIDFESIVNARDRALTGNISSMDLRKILMDIGLAISESDDTSNDKLMLKDVEEAAETTSRQVARISELRKTREIRGFHRTRKNYDIEDESDEEFTMREAQLDIVRRYREGQKRALVGTKLRSAISTEKTIYPSFGKPVFFETKIHNPYPHEDTFELLFNDPEIRVITDSQEWRLYRDLVPENQRDDFGPIEHEMIQPNSNRITLSANETVSVPFVFLSFCSGSVFESNKRSSKYNIKKETRPPILKRTIDVRVSSVRHSYTIALLKVNINPVPFSVDNVMRLAHPKDEYLKSRIRLHDADGLRERYVYCGDANVVADWKPPNELFLKYRSSKFDDFYVLLYNDPFHVQLHQIWHICVQPMQRIDIHAVVGQSSVSELVVRGDKFARRVRCYSTSPGEVQFFPPKSFQLVAGAYNKVEMVYRPYRLEKDGNHGSDEKRVWIHMVDVESNELISAWLLHISTKLPEISKSFDIEVPLHQSCHKKLAYVNPWDHPHTFIIRTSHPLSVRIKEPKLEIPPKTKGYIRLWIKAEHEPKTSQVLLFVNDQNDQNEECISITLNYVE